MMFRGSQPGLSELDWTIDWSRWLAGDTVVTSIWTAVPAGLTLYETSTSIVGNTTTCWMKGGTVTGYLITNRITTAAGRITSATIELSLEPPLI